MMMVLIIATLTMNSGLHIIRLAEDLNFDQKFGVGGSYRTGDGVYFLAKYSITPSIRLAYSYDYALSPLSTFAAGSHEIMLSYRIKLLPPPEEKEIHPRYYF